jgi:hypothetical protein
VVYTVVTLLTVLMLAFARWMGCEESRAWMGHVVWRWFWAGHCHHHGGPGHGLSQVDGLQLQQVRREQGLDGPRGLEVEPMPSHPPPQLLARPRSAKREKEDC